MRRVPGRLVIAALSIVCPMTGKGSGIPLPSGQRSSVGAIFATARRCSSVWRSLNTGYSRSRKDELQAQ